MHPATDWRLVVPIKHADLAKTRLQPAAPLTRRGLAVAMAADTLEAACDCVGAAQLLVVTSDLQATERAADLGAHTIPDPGAGLNAAIDAGVQWWRQEVPVPVAVLLGDLPALRAVDLQVALDACGRYDRAVVPDAGGSGSVLLTAAPGAALRPRFGVGSAVRHAEDAELLELDLPRLRSDVDDLNSLLVVASLGVGRHTGAELAAARLDAGA